MGVSKNRGNTPKMDGLFHGNPMNKWMIWGYHYFWKHPYILIKNNIHLGRVFSRDLAKLGQEQLSSLTPFNVFL